MTIPHLSIRARILALTVAAAMSAAASATAQEPSTPSTTKGPHLTVKVQADGRLLVDAASTPVSEVIRAVAAASGFEVSQFGAMPNNMVTVLYHGRAAEEILTDLMKSAGINYVLTGGSGSNGRLFMATFDTKLGVSHSLPEPVIARAVAAQAVPAQDLKEIEAETPAQPEPPQPETNDKPAQPTEWPADIAPATSPGVRLPQTREELFREVNGTVATTLPPDVTPNVGPVRSPDQYEPVNGPRGNAPTGAFGASATVARPGAVVPDAMTANPVMPGQQMAAPPPEMMQAPRTIQVPGPVVVQFPPPKKPS